MQFIAAFASIGPMTTPNSPPELISTPDTIIRVREKHPLAVRISHWINFPFMLLMIWSGILIYWANPAYWPHLPDRFYTVLGFEGRLAEGLAYHFTAMWIFTLNGIFYICYLAFSGEWRNIVPDLQSFKDAPRVALHELGIIKTAPPHGKLNGAQRIAYTAILICGAVAVFTGLAIYKPIQLSFLKESVGGYTTARWIHYWIMIVFILFIVMHVLQVIKAGWNKFRAMIAGYEVTDDKTNLEP